MEQLDVLIEDKVATVMMDNPPVNAASPTLLRELRSTMESFSVDRSANAVILTAKGSRAFMAGADLKAPVRPVEDMTAAELLDRGRAGRDLYWSIYDCAVPVIAAVNGPAIGLGLGIAAVCDIILASEQAFFQTSEINVGLLGSGSHLGLLMGRFKARELFFTGRPISATELYKMGSISQVVAADKLLDAARELAEELATKSPIALRLAKESMNRIEFLALKEAYRMEQDYTNRLLTFEDSEEARAAWRDRRQPEWRWR